MHIANLSATPSTFRYLPIGAGSQTREPHEPKTKEDVLYNLKLFRPRAISRGLVVAPVESDSDGPF